MTLDEIKQILEMMREHELAEFELERDGVTLRLRKNVPPWSGTLAQMPSMPPPPAPAAPAAAPPAAAPPEPAVLEPANEDLDLAIVKSPIVGTFYRAPEPGAPSFVDTGQMVRKGQVLCIIEAMKLMNEIESDVDGEVLEIYPQNAQPVEFGEPLFAVRPSGS